MSSAALIKEQLSNLCLDSALGFNAWLTPLCQDYFASLHILELFILVYFTDKELFETTFICTGNLKHCVWVCGWVVAGAQFMGLLGQSAASQGANPRQHTLNMKGDITVCLSPLGDIKCTSRKSASYHQFQKWLEDWLPILRILRPFIKNNKIDFRLFVFQHNSEVLWKTQNLSQQLFMHQNLKFLLRKTSKLARKGLGPRGFAVSST